MKKVWVVVANSSIAKIYRAEGSNLTEHSIFYHDEGHLHASDLLSDRQGQETYSSICGGDTYQAKTTVKAKEANLFATSIAQFLEKGAAANEYDSLYIIAKPPFLGHLREQLNHNLSKLIKEEIAKDLTQLSTKELRELLPPIL